MLNCSASLKALPPTDISEDLTMLSSPADSDGDDTDGEEDEVPFSVSNVNN